ncbi:MAG TPA: MmcQ/YjbR family DNA-binding protein [Solirubrobacterales bacterium]
MTGEWLRARCLGHPGTWEDFPFGEEPSVFKVGPKMFALSRLDGEPLAVSLKVSPEIGDDLRATYAAVAPGYHLNKRHWITVTLDGSLPAATVEALIEDSYDLVVDGLTRKERERLPT